MLHKGNPNHSTYKMALKSMRFKNTVLEAYVLCWDRVRRTATFAALPELWQKRACLGEEPGRLDHLGQGGLPSDV